MEECIWAQYFQDVQASTEIQKEEYTILNSANLEWNQKECGTFISATARID